MSAEGTTYHIPVLLTPSVDGLNIHPDGTYVDVTFGGGGHSREILSRLGERGRLLGFDQDGDAERNIVSDPRFTFVRSNFRYLRNFLRYYGAERVDGVLADLGVSSHHLDEGERGFSFRLDGALDMRMNKRNGKPAADVVGGRAGQGPEHGENNDDRTTGKRRRTALKSWTGKKGIGQGVPGFAHRGEPGNGRTERNVASRHTGIEAGRKAGGHYVPLAGGPHGEEYSENGKRGRKGGTGFLRTAACAA